MSNIVLNAFKKSNDSIQNWNTVFHFAAICAISTTSLSNIWRYPSFTYPEGRGTFLLIYLFVLVILGIPIYYLEVILGQFSSKANSEAFHSISYGLIGIGWSQAFTSLCIATYFSTFATYELYYFIRCFSTVLPWTICKTEWNKTCSSLLNITNSSEKINLSEELYFDQEIIQLKAEIGNIIKIPNIHLVICLFSIWLVVFLLLLNEVKLNEYVGYCMTSFIYISLITLMRRTSYFDGAVNATKHYFNFSTLTLTQPKIWYRAIQQCVVSIGLGTGTITTLSSHNKFYYRAKTLSIAIVMFHFLTNVLFEMTNYSIIGHLALKLNTTLENITDSIPWITFVGYPSVLATIKTDILYIYMAMFYLMMLISSISSLFGLEIVVTKHLQYCFPILNNWQSGIITTLVSFCISILFLTPGGYYALNICNNYCNQLAITTIVLSTIVTIQYHYGLQNFCWDAEYMSQTVINSFWRITWSIVDPILIAATVMYSLISIKDASYGISNSINYHIVAGLLLFCLLVSIPGCMLYFSLNKKTNNRKNHDTWRPIHEEHYNEWKELKSKVTEKYEIKCESRIVKFGKSLWRLYD